MHRSLWLIVGLAALAASAACNKTVNVEQERAALLAVDREWSQTAKDLDKYFGYFAADAAIYAPGMPVLTGIDAIRKTFTEMSKTPGFAISWTAAKADVAASGDIGHTSGAYELTMGGTTEKGKYFTAWKKQSDGAWKVTDDIFNADAAPKAPIGTHAMTSASTLTWGPAPPGLPAGSQVAVVSGDPSKAEPFVLRAQFPANYRIPLHWLPTTENITVLSGTVAIGMGALDPSKMQDLPAGGFASLPAEMRHSFMAKTAATIQVHGTGPFDIRYENQADDPRTK